MSWVYRFDERALKELRKLGKQAQCEIIAYLDDRIADDADPRRFGKGHKADLAGLWRYRVGDHRILCQIKDLSFSSSPSTKSRYHHAGYTVVIGQRMVRRSDQTGSAHNEILER